MSLIEVIVVVAIVAILGMLTFLSYLEYSQRARRIDAKAALEQIAVNQERIYALRFVYTSNLAELGFPGNRSEAGFYTISVPIVNATGFQAIAVPAPGSPQEKDADCIQFTIDTFNLRTAAPDTEGNCW